MAEVMGESHQKWRMELGLRHSGKILFWWLIAIVKGDLELSPGHLSYTHHFQFLYMTTDRKKATDQLVFLCCLMKAKFQTLYWLFLAHCLRFSTLQSRHLDVQKRTNCNRRGRKALISKCTYPTPIIFLEINLSDFYEISTV